MLHVLTRWTRLFQQAGGIGAFLAFVLFTVPALAQSQEGASTLHAPKNWQLNMGRGVTPVAERLDSFHHMMLWIITGITVFVLVLLLYTVVRYRRSANPVPSKVTHHTMLEVAWTVLPVLILVVIAVPSFRILYYMDKATKPEMTVKVTGHQWYWSYELPDQKIEDFTSNMIPDDKIQPEQIKKLSVDYPLVIPVNTDIQLLISGADVIHSWLVPLFGVQRHAVPGRTQETWTRVTEEGTFYGQCNQICGTLHAYMPIEIRVVSKEKFQQWVQAVQTSTAKDKMRDANERILGISYRWQDSPKTADAAQQQQVTAAQ